MDTCFASLSSETRYFRYFVTRYHRFSLITVSIVIEPELLQRFTTQQVIIVQKPSEAGQSFLKGCKVARLCRDARRIGEPLDVSFITNSTQRNLYDRTLRPEAFPVVLLLKSHMRNGPGYTLEIVHPSLLFDHSNPLQVIWSKFFSDLQPITIQFCSDKGFFDPDSLQNGVNRRVDTYRFRIQSLGMGTRSHFSFSRLPEAIIIHIADRLWDRDSSSVECRSIFQFALTEKACSIVVCSYFKMIGSQCGVWNTRGLITALKYRPGMISLLRECSFCSFGASIQEVHDECTNYAEILALLPPLRYLKLNHSVWDSSENLLANFSSITMLHLLLESSRKKRTIYWEDDEDYPLVNMDISRIYDVIKHWALLESLTIVPSHPEFLRPEESSDPPQCPQESTLAPFSAPFSLVDLKIASLPLSNSHLLSLLAQNARLARLELINVAGIDNNGLRTLLSSVSPTIEKITLLDCKLHRGRPFCVDVVLPNLPRLVELKINDEQPLGSTATIAGKRHRPGAPMSHASKLTIGRWDNRGSITEALEVTGWTSITLYRGGYFGGNRIRPKSSWYRIARRRNIALDLDDF